MHIDYSNVMQRRKANKHTIVCCAVDPFPLPHLQPSFCCLFKEVIDILKELL